jgi:hypothetical protein
MGLRLDRATAALDWFSPAQWNMAKLPFSSALVPLYADHAARLLAAIRGKNRRTASGRHARLWDLAMLGCFFALVASRSCRFFSFSSFFACLASSD